MCTPPANAPRRGALLAEPPQRRPRRGLLPDGRRPGQRHQRGGQPRARRPRRPRPSSAAKEISAAMAMATATVASAAQHARTSSAHATTTRRPAAAGRLAVAQHGQRVAEDPRGVPAGAAPRAARPTPRSSSTPRPRDFGPEALGAPRVIAWSPPTAPAASTTQGRGAAAGGNAAAARAARARVERREREHAARREGHRPLALPRGQHRTRDEHGGAERGRGVQRGVDALEEGRVRLCVEIPRLRCSPAPLRDSVELKH